MAAWAQSRTPRIAWISMVSPASRAGGLDPFLEGMARLGYQAGKNFELDERWGENSREALERLALEALALKPALFVSQGPALQVARKLPAAVPVVFGTSGDPIEMGVAASLARPGGNLTGVTFLSYALVGKRVELLHEVAPNARRLAILSNPEHGGDAKELAATREAAVGLGMEASHYPVSNAQQMESALAATAAARAEALVVHPDALMVEQRAAIARFSLERRVPLISGWAAIADGGGLMTYGPNLQECYRRLAYFVDRVLRGARPGEIPIELPSTVELVVNLKTAKALGITVPPAVLLRADRVIV
ncbi:MAG TPA: ABC transporter substrate-binding protein [Burkholderiales bacterium]|nr:ABC transporter substrate-binding protein [Burkholderiales bacterium]